MKLFGTLSLLVGAALATPFHHARQSTKAPDSFYLKTSGSENSAHNDLYVYGYHTGAGLNDAVLTPDVGTASKAFMNGTNVQFDFNSNFPWGLYPIGVTNYAAWQFVELNVGYGAGDFSVNSTGLQWSEQKGFGGWLVCDWYHNAPQLFYIYRYYTAEYPASCSRVKLLTESTA
ncbi:hypothetical protein BJY00DRAFT_71391 [Aspergillus carlsbadensis]|nr:hypothetical protein BJY00DRAFT_71391 [Aspergillus carlsbadensis]